MKKLNIALVGLAFGGAFLPIYLDHPCIATVGVFDTDTNVLNTMKERYPSIQLYKSFDEILQDSSIDAVHLVTPIPLHADQTVAVLESGKHCACTVPMATSLEELQRIVDAKRKSGKNFMMMERNPILWQKACHG